VLPQTAICQICRVAVGLDTPCRARWRSRYAMRRDDVLAEALRNARHSKQARVLPIAMARRSSRDHAADSSPRGECKRAPHPAHTFCSHVAMCKAHLYARFRNLQVTVTWLHAAVHAPQSGGARRRDSVVGDGRRDEPCGRGEIVEAAGKSRPSRY
jgi:hypothetical protein